MPFPTHVLVTLTKEGSFSCPPEEFREKMMAALKIYFLKKLEEEPWSDVEPALCYEEQRIPLFKEKRMMPKLWKFLMLIFFSASICIYTLVKMLIFALLSFFVQGGFLTGPL